MKIPSTWLLIALPSVLMAQARPPVSAIVLKPDRVFDGTSEQVHAGWVVVVEGNRITAVGPAASVHAPPGARTLDLPPTTLLPRPTDFPSHIFLHPYAPPSWTHH